MGDYASKLRARTLGRNQQPTATKTDAPKQMTNSEFMRERRMFCVIDGMPYVAEPNDSRYHREWMNELVGGQIDDRTYNQSPRGFYLAPEMVWYRGSMQPVSMRSITDSLPALALMMALPLDTEVYSGAHTGHDDVFKGANLIGTINEIQDY